MNALLGFVVLALLIAAIVGAIRPHAVLPKALKPSRGKAVAIYVGLLLAMGLIGSQVEKAAEARRMKDPRYAAAKARGAKEAAARIQYKKEQEQRDLAASRQAKEEATTAKREASARKEVATIAPTEPLDLIEYQGSYDENFTTIVGVVRNNTAKTYRYVQIAFSLYDESNNLVGTALANVNNLDAGGNWKFKAVGFTPAKSFKLSKLTGF